ncbi:MAG: LysE family transporter [Melioribacteraceae bacterium]
MTESFITILLLGLLAGFFFSVPIAGPISILITSNALKGKRRFCLRTALGGAVVEFFYVFIAVFGLTSFFAYYQNLIPLILIVGSLFLFFVAYKIIKTQLTLDDIKKEKVVKDKLANKGGFRTGILLNFTNPSLFLGWFTSSFLLLSFASSVGLNTGGLDIMMNNSVASIEEVTGKKFDGLDELKNGFSNEQIKPIGESTLSPLVLSLTYAATVGIGSYIWFYLLTHFLIKYKERLKIEWINGLIKLLGVFLFLIAAYLVYEGIVLL